MSMQDARLTRLGLRLIAGSGLARALSPWCRGIGAIFMLHHILPGGGAAEGFAPNAGLEVTPEFLRAAIDHVRARGYEVVPLAEAVERVRAGGSPRPFAVFTIDDGYRDNIDHALPVFRTTECPFTIFIAPGIVDGTCELWWRLLELVIARLDRIETDVDGAAVTLSCGTIDEKRQAFDRFYWPVRRMEEHDQRRFIRALAGRHGIDPDAYCRSVAMDWEDVRMLAAEPLCTIGAHTNGHYALARLPVDEALSEAAGSADRLERETGARPRFFAYPYGDEGSAGPRDFALVAEAGFTAAVTTRKGMVKPAHAAALTALPRVSLNGLYQDLAVLDVLLTGVPFAARDAVRRLTGRGEAAVTVPDRAAASTR